MTYTIGEIAKRFSLSISTLRYYDKEGLFPDMERTSGIRRFSEREIETIKLIECLKKSGLEIKDIRQFMQWIQQGKDTYKQRKQLFATQQRKVEEELKRMEQVHDMLIFKNWYYDQLLSGADEGTLKERLEEMMPPAIRKAYTNAFRE